MRLIEKDGISLMRLVDVGDETAAAGDKPRIFAARNRLSNAETHAGVLPRQ
jgi:hypothetical protein